MKMVDIIKENEILCCMNVGIKQLTVTDQYFYVRIFSVLAPTFFCTVFEVLATDWADQVNFPENYCKIAFISVCDSGSDEN